MALKIVSVGDPVLRQPARALSAKEIVSPAIQKLIEQMRETMHAAPGVGLAAPQIGESLQLAVIEDRAEYHHALTPAQMAERERKPVAFHAIINPTLHLLPGPQPEFFEGCLSLPGLTAIVPRAREVRVECLDHRGEPRIIEAFGWYARILQHEIDHLRGTIYVDRMHSRSLSTIENYQQHWPQRRVAGVLQELKR